MEKKLEKVTLSKGYDILDKEYEKRFCGRPVEMVDNDIGVSLRYAKKESKPLIIYSYLMNLTDIKSFMKNSARYIDILADASI